MAGSILSCAYVWAWGSGKIGRMPGRKGQRCRVLVRGSRNSCLIEFEDGEQFVTSRNGLRKASAHASNNGKVG
jgi:hypothetical protein